MLGFALTSGSASARAGSSGTVPSQLWGRKPAPTCGSAYGPEYHGSQNPARPACCETGASRWDLPGQKRRPSPGRSPAVPAAEPRKTPPAAMAQQPGPRQAAAAAQRSLAQIRDPASTRIAALRRDPRRTGHGRSAVGSRAPDPPPGTAGSVWSRQQSVPLVHDSKLSTQDATRAMSKTGRSDAQSWPSCVVEGQGSEDGPMGGRFFGPWYSSASPARGSR